MRIETGESLLKVTSTAVKDYEEIIARLRENYKITYPGGMRMNDRDDGVHGFIKIKVWEVQNL